MSDMAVSSWMKVLSALVKDNPETWILSSSLKPSIFPQPFAVLFSLLRGHYLRTGHSPNPQQIVRILLASGLHADKVKRITAAYEECAKHPSDGWDVDSLIEEYQERVYVEALEKAVLCLSEPVILPGSKVSIGGIQGARMILHQVEMELDPSERDSKESVKAMYIRQVEVGSLPFIEMPLFKGLFDIFRCELWLLSAFSGEGKTTLMLNLAVEAYLQGESVVIISLETEPYKLKWKLAVLLSGRRGTPISLTDVVYHKLTDEHKQIFFNCLEESNNIRIKECAGTGMHEILGMLRSVPKATLVFVDNLNLTSKRTKEYFDKISEGLKSIAKFTHRSKNLTVIVLAQSNRMGHKEAVAQGRYSLTSLADSNEAERTPDGVFWILQTDFLKSIVGFSKFRMLPSNTLQTRNLVLNPDTLVFSIDGSSSANQSPTKGGTGFNPNSIDLGED